MERITDAFSWPLRDSEWATKILIIGLILIVPIVGAINGLGWMLVGLDRLRAGDEKLPPARFSYIGRGWALFVVNVVYILALGLVMAAVFIPLLAVETAEGRGSVNAVLLTLAAVLNLLLFSVGAFGTLAIYVAMPAIILCTDRGGVGGGLNLHAVVGRMRETPINTLIAGLMLIAVGFVAQLGLIACVVGVLFTSAYALAAQAWIVRSYELGSSAPATP